MNKKEIQERFREQNFEHNSLGDLISVLLSYNLDKRVTDHENQEYIHVVSRDDGGTILTTEKPIGYCNRSSGYVYPTTVEDYVGVSTELDENVDFGEFSLPILDEEENPSKFGEPIERASKYKEPFYLLLKRVQDILPQEVWEELYKFDVNLETE